jgi:hypothetical protein
LHGSLDRTFILCFTENSVFVTFSCCNGSHLGETDVVADPKTNSCKVFSLVDELSTNHLLAKMFTCIEEIEGTSTRERFAFLRWKSKSAAISINYIYLECDFAGYVNIEKMDFSMHRNQFA